MFTEHVLQNQDLSRNNEVLYLNNFHKIIRQGLELIIYFLQESGNKESEYYSALAFLKKVDKQILRLVNNRRCKRPMIDIGLDGGGDQKLVCSLFLHDLDNPKPDNERYKEGGWRKAIILAEGDYCPEVILQKILCAPLNQAHFQTYENIKLMIMKLNLLQSLTVLTERGIPYMFIGDNKMVQECTGN